MKEDRGAVALRDRVARSAARTAIGQIAQASSVNTVATC